MSSDLALTTSAVDPSVAAAMEVYARIDAVKAVLAPDLTDQELRLFAMVAQRSGLDPFARQIYAVKRGGRVTFQTGIDGYRSTAERTGQYLGSDEPEFGPIVGGHPESARVTVYRLRNGERVAQSATAYWAEFHPGGTQPMWTKMPRNQLAKCAEALALRKAFPYVFADLYTDAEMDQAGPAENSGAAAAAAQPTARERLAARRAALEQPVATEPPTEPNDEPAPDPVATPPAEEGSFRDADATDEPSAAPGPKLADCEWRLGQGQGKPTLRCGMELGPDGTHEGEHSWQPVAMTTGGRVMKPGAA